MQREEDMEHHSLMTLVDETEITYSDLKQNSNGQCYFTVYFETPSEKYGFCSMDINYPNGKPQNIIGYSDSDIERLLYHYSKVAPVIFEDLNNEEYIYA